MVDVETFWSIMSIMLFIGGLSMGWYARDWKQVRKMYNE